MTRTLFSFILFSLLASPLAAQDATAPRFFIERIEVRNAARVTPGVVIAESRLREGQEYSETELSDAAARLNRLPFLLSADFALERGSERGRHVLVVTVNETRPFFFLVDSVPVLAETEANEGGPNIQYNNVLASSENQGVLGFRFFVGRRGAIHFGIFARDDNRDYTRDYSAFVVGYTQYDLFGTRAFATLNLRRPIADSSSARISPELVVGIPLSGNQTVTLSYEELNFGRQRQGQLDNAITRQDGQRVLSARWSFDTTNNPFLPTSGTLVSVTPLVAWRDSAGAVYAFENQRFSAKPETIHSRSLGIDAVANRFWEVSERDSVSAGVEGGWAAVDERRDGYLGPRDTDHDPHYAIFRTGYSHSLWDRSERKHGDSRLEVGLGYVSRYQRRETLTSDGQVIDLSRNTDDVQISASWVRRSSWGTVRLGVGYAW